MSSQQTVAPPPIDISAWTPAPVRLVRAARLQVEQHELFQLLTDHEGLPGLFPWMERVTVDNSQAVIPNGLGARRTCYFNGMVLAEEMVAWEPNYLCGYAGEDATHPFGMQGHLGLMVCEAAASTETVFWWSHAYNHANLAAMQAQLESSVSLSLNILIERFSGQLLLVRKERQSLQEKVR